MKSDEAKQVLQSWVDQQKHNRCWYYPEIFNRLCEILGVTPTVTPNLPSRIQFEIGCKHFQDDQFGSVCAIGLDKNDKPVISGTDFTLSQLIGELAIGRSLSQICEAYNLPIDETNTALIQLAALLDK